MGKAAEAGNDVPMPNGIVKERGKGFPQGGGGLCLQGREQLDRTFLALQGFGMFERQIAENPLEQPARLVGSKFQPFQA